MRRVRVRFNERLKSIANDTEGLDGVKDGSCPNSTD